MPECDMLLDTQLMVIADEEVEVNETTLFAAVRVMRKEEAEVLKRRIEEASNASLSSIRIVEEACTEAAKRVGLNNVKAGCFLRTRVPQKKFADFAVLPVKKGGKPRNVVITRQKSQLSKQLANVVAAKKARFFSDSPTQANRHHSAHVTNRSKSSSQNCTAERKDRSTSNSVYQTDTTSETTESSANRVVDDDELQDDYTVPWCSEAIRANSRKKEERRGRIESVGDDTQTEADADSSAPRTSRRLTNSSVLRSAMRRKEVANEASWRSTSLGRTRPRCRAFAQVQRCMRPATGWFSLPSRKTHSSRSSFVAGAPFLDRARALRLARAYATPQNTECPVTMNSAAASEVSAAAAAACSLLFGQSAVQISKQQRRPSAVPTILQRGRTVNVPSKKPTVRSSPKKDEGDSATGSVNSNANATRSEAPQATITSIVASESIKPRTVTVAATLSCNRPLSASELFKFHMKTSTCATTVQVKQTPAVPLTQVYLTSSNASVSADHEVKVDCAVPAERVPVVPHPPNHTTPSIVQSNATKAPSVAQPAPVASATVRKPSTVLELLRYRQAQAQAQGKNAAKEPSNSTVAAASNSVSS